MSAKKDVHVHVLDHDYDAIHFINDEATQMVNDRIKLMAQYLT